MFSRRKDGMELLSRCSELSSSVYIVLPPVLFPVIVTVIPGSPLPVKSVTLSMVRRTAAFLPSFALALADTVILLFVSARRSSPSTVQ